MKTTLLSAVLAGLLLSACSDTGSFTLYRNSAVDESMRLHVATFDAKDGEKYNQGNCEIARTLFQQQEGVKVRFWCEKGRFQS